VCNLTPLNNLYFRPTLLVLLHTSSFTRLGLLVISLLIFGCLFCSISILNIKKTNKIHKNALMLQRSRDPRKKKAKERPKAGTSMDDWWD